MAVQLQKELHQAGGQSDSYFESLWSGHLVVLFCIHFPAVPCFLAAAFISSFIFVTCTDFSLCYTEDSSGGLF